MSRSDRSASPSSSRYEFVNAVDGARTGAFSQGSLSAASVRMGPYVESVAARRRTKLVLLAAVLGTLVVSSPASGQFLTVYGGPAEDPQNHYSHGSVLATSDARAGSGVAV